MYIIVVFLKFIASAFNVVQIQIFMYYLEFLLTRT